MLSRGYDQHRFTAPVSTVAFFTYVVSSSVHAPCKGVRVQERIRLTEAQISVRLARIASTRAPVPPVPWPMSRHVQVACAGPAKLDRT